MNNRYIIGEIVDIIGYGITKIYEFFSSKFNGKNNHSRSKTTSVAKERMSSDSPPPLVAEEA